MGEYVTDLYDDISYDIRNEDDEDRLTVIWLGKFDRLLTISP